jgi:hypothetical protein
MALSLLITPIACLGCAQEGVAVDEKTGGKRRQMMEDLQKKAELKRKSQEKRKASSR